MANEEKIAEYESLRNEISQRLGFQQQIINFTIVVAGFLVPLLLNYKNLGDSIILSLFILGAFISIVLAFVSLKQQIIIAQLSEYISKEIKVNNSCIFEGWEKWHLDYKLRKHSISGCLLKFMGISDVGFPIIVSSIYLLGFLVLIFRRGIVFNASIVLFISWLILVGFLIFILFQSCKIRKLILRKSS